MGALVFNINATPKQTPESTALTNNQKTIIPSTASATQGTTTPTMDAAKTISTTGVLIAGYAIKQSANIITSNVGRLTGNSHLQNQVNANLKFGATMVGLFTHPLMTSLALAADGVNYAINTYYTETESKARSAQAQAIAGTLRGMKH